MNYPSGKVLLRVVPRQHQQWHRSVATLLLCFLMLQNCNGSHQVSATSYHNHRATNGNSLLKEKPPHPAATAIALLPREASAPFSSATSTQPDCYDHPPYYAASPLLPFAASPYHPNTAPYPTETLALLHNLHPILSEMAVHRYWGGDTSALVNNKQEKALI